MAVDPLVDVIVGGQYGSEGKGNIVSYIAPEYDYLIRVGGPNAGHKVYMEPQPYTFHLLPSGTRNSEARLIIGPGAVLRVDVLLEEIRQCGVETGRLIVDEQAMIITTEDMRREKSLVSRIASTGQGAGAATARKIMGRADKRTTLAKDTPALKGYVGCVQEEYEKAYREGKRILLEGTQGTSLSIHHGSYPWVTSRDTSASGCLSEAGISPRRVRKVMMVCRTYPIRVGNAKAGGSGPMSQEIDLRAISRRSGIPLRELEKTERTSTTNRPRRIGEFDWELLRKNSQINAPTDIALTFVDYLSILNRAARRYEQLEPDTLRFIEEVERVASAPVTLISTRFHSRSVIDRRIW
jgi:adenylosuccinate synthase